MDIFFLHITPMTKAWQVYVAFSWKTKVSGVKNSSAKSWEALKLYHFLFFLEGKQNK